MRELIVDGFAGGGGASTGIEMALGRSPDLAYNHDPVAVAMHLANHPETRHVCRNIYKVDPADEIGGRPLGLGWFSPDCKHHSKAKGGKPVDRNIRDLAWVVVLWAKRARPRVIMLENVEEFQQWGPLIEGPGGGLYPDPKRKGETYKKWVRELERLGYRVEWKELRGCHYGAPTIRKRLFVVARRDGEDIVWPDVRFGGPKDLAVQAGKLPMWPVAADIIDWSIPCHSIFLSREEGRRLGVNRPLAEATMARIAKGIRRYVLEAKKPFIVNLTHGGRVEPVDAPLNTVTGAHRGEKAVVAPVLSHAQQGGRSRGPDEPVHTVTASTKDQNQVVLPYLVPRYGERPGQDPRTRSVEDPAPAMVPDGNGASLVAPHLTPYYGERRPGEERAHDAGTPLHTLTTENRFGVVSAHLTKFRTDSAGSSVEEPVPTVTANSFVKRPGGAPPIGVVSAFLAQHNTGLVGHDAREPVSTIVGLGSTQGIVAANLVNLRGEGRGGADIEAPAPTLTAGGTHLAEVRAFMTKYYGTGQESWVDEPIHTLTGGARFGLVIIEGEPYEIVDIGMRMLTPREMFRAQGFPDSYIIDHGIFVGDDGSRRKIAITKTAQTRLCGNSVCPPISEALVDANCPDLAVGQSRFRQRA